MFLLLLLYLCILLGSLPLKEASCESRIDSEFPTQESEIIRGKQEPSIDPNRGSSIDDAFGKILLKSLKASSQQLPQNSENSIRKGLSELLTPQISENTVRFINPTTLDISQKQRIQPRRESPSLYNQSIRSPRRRQLTNEKSFPRRRNQVLNSQGDRAPLFKTNEEDSWRGKTDPNNKEIGEVISNSNHGQSHATLNPLKGGASHLDQRPPFNDERALISSKNNWKRRNGAKSSWKETQRSTNKSPTKHPRQVNGQDTETKFSALKHRDFSREFMDTLVQYRDTKDDTKRFQDAASLQGIQQLPSWNIRYDQQPKQPLTIFNPKENEQNSAVQWSPQNARQKLERDSFNDGTNQFRLKDSKKILYATQPGLLVTKKNTLKASNEILSNGIKNTTLLPNTNNRSGTSFSIPKDKQLSLRKSNFNAPNTQKLIENSLLKSPSIKTLSRTPKHQGHVQSKTSSLDIYPKRQYTNWRLVSPTNWSVWRTKQDSEGRQVFRSRIKPEVSINNQLLKERPSGRLIRFFNRNQLARKGKSGNLFRQKINFDNSLRVNQGYNDRRYRERKSSRSHQYNNRIRNGRKLTAKKNSFVPAKNSFGRLGLQEHLPIANKSKVTSGHNNIFLPGQWVKKQSTLVSSQRDKTSKTQQLSNTIRSSVRSNPSHELKRPHLDSLSAPESFQNNAASINQQKMHNYPKLIDNVGPEYWDGQSFLDYEYSALLEPIKTHRPRHLIPNRNIPEESSDAVPLTSIPPVPRQSTNQEAHKTTALKKEKYLFSNINENKVNLPLSPETSVQDFGNWSKKKPSKQVINRDSSKSKDHLLTGSLWRDSDNEGKHQKSLKSLGISSPMNGEASYQSRQVPQTRGSLSSQIRKILESHGFDIRWLLVDLNEELHDAQGDTNHYHHQESPTPNHESLTPDPLDNDEESENPSHANELDIRRNPFLRSVVKKDYSRR